MQRQMGGLQRNLGLIPACDGRQLGATLRSVEMDVMKMRFEPKGTWTALVTPFDREGKLDESCFRRLAQFQVAEGVSGLVPCGTTGESPTLEWQEHTLLVRAAVSEAKGRVGVLAGTGSNSTAEAISGTRDAMEDGASAALLVDCYYNGPSSLELRCEYYQRVLDAVPGFPIVPYVIPGRTGCTLEAADLAILHLSAPECVPAVKSATGNLERMREDRKLGGASLSILSGDDDMTVTMMRDPLIGASGVISVMSNIAPAAVSKLVAALAANDTETAHALQRALSPLFRLVGVKASSERRLPNGVVVEVCDRYRNPLSVKTMMSGLGMIEGLCRPPLGRMQRPAVETCRAALRQVWEQNPEILEPLETAFDTSIEQRLSSDAVWAGLSC